VGGGALKSKTVYVWRDRASEGVLAGNMRSMLPTVDRRRACETEGGWIVFLVEIVTVALCVCERGRE